MFHLNLRFSPYSFMIYFVLGRLIKLAATFSADVTRASESDHRSMVLCSHPPTASINRATMGTSAGASRSTHRRINNFYLDILCSPYTEVVDRFVLPFSLVVARRNASRARQTRPNATTGVHAQPNRDITGAVTITIFYGYL